MPSPSATLPALPDGVWTPGDPRVLVLGRHGCHLCDVAKDLVARVVGEQGGAWHELDVDEDLALYERYTDLVPVIVVDGAPIARWRVSEFRLREALRDQPAERHTGR